MTAATPWWRRPLAQALLALVVAGAFGLFFTWPALEDPDRFHDNWRQSPHWLSPDKKHFQDDDLIVRYSEFNTSPFANALYKTLALTGHDILWGKVLTVAVFALGALSCFLAANAMAGPAAGWAAVVVFLFFPSAYEHFVGGFMSCFSWPLLGFAVLVIYRRRWWWSLPLVAFSALAYPMVALQIGMMFLIDTIYHDLWIDRLRDREVWRRKILPLALAALALTAVLGVKYFDDHGFGELVTRADMAGRSDFTSEGRYRILPTVALWTRFERAFENPFHLALLIVAVLLLGRNALRLPRGVYSLLAAGILMYYLSDLLVMRLYLPSRYLRRTLPLFACLAAGIWWARIYYSSMRNAAGMTGNKRSEKLAPVALLTVGLIFLGFREFGDELELRQHTRVFDEHELYAAIDELPGRPMIAAWPSVSSELPLMTGRTVLVNREHAHPWWTDYWEEVRERTQDYWRAYYTLEPEELRRVIDKYDIDYWVIEPKYYDGNRMRRRRVHYEPLNRWFRRLRRPPGALLSRVPPQVRLHDAGHFYIVASEDVLRWLESQ